MKRMRWLAVVAAAALMVACDGDGGVADAVGGDGAGSDVSGTDAVRDLGAPRAMLGYLYAECPWQAFPSAPELGDGCLVDVFLASTPPGEGVPDVCAGGDEGPQPFTSRCLLDDLGVAVDPGAPVRLDGADGTTRICAIGAKESASGDVEAECADGAIFAPTAVAPALPTGTYELVVDRALSGDYEGGLPHDPLTEADYVPADNKTGHVVRTEDDGATIRVTPSCSAADGVNGTRTPGVPLDAAGGVLYDLGDGTFAGGRFVFWIAEDGELQAEYTIYGSGRPIVLSERGSFAPITCP